MFAQRCHILLFLLLVAFIRSAKSSVHCKCFGLQNKNDMHMNNTAII